MTGSTEAGSLKRGVEFLKLLAAAGRSGLPLTGLATQTDLPHPSVHRVLKQLVAARLVEQNPDNKRYRLGPFAFELGLASSLNFDLRGVCEPSMLEVASATGNTVYLFMRSGHGEVCVHRVDGRMPIRTSVWGVGTRRLLGVGAGGLAILAALNEPQRGDIIKTVAPILSRRSGLTAEVLTTSCRESREIDTSIIHDTVIPGVNAVGVAIRNSSDEPVGAISVAAWRERMPLLRMREIGRQLLLVRTAIEEQLRAQRCGAW